MSAVIGYDLRVKELSTNHHQFYKILWHTSLASTGEDISAAIGYDLRVKEFSTNHRQFYKRFGIQVWHPQVKRYQQ